MKSTFPRFLFLPVIILVSPFSDLLAGSAESEAALAKVTEIVGSLE
jgi:hypothetical protein